MTAPFPDLSVHIARRRRRCVLDPNLALSRHGAMLARLIAPYAELWVGPEHFTILDNALLYQQEPELLIWPHTDKTAIAEVPEVLRDWTRLRDEAGQCLHWLGDAWRESCVPQDIHETVHPRCEAASRTLDLCLPKTIEATGPLIAAMRDTAALCAVLSARILGRGTRSEPPLICRHLQQWGLACKKVPAEDALAEVERVEFMQVIVEAGVAPLVWDGLQLAIVHLCVPYVGRLEGKMVLGADDEPAMLPDAEETSPPGNPWEGASCFWYDVTEPTL